MPANERVPEALEAMDDNVVVHEEEDTSTRSTSSHSWGAEDFEDYARIAL